MSSNLYDDILRRAQQLSPEERRKLIDELSSEAETTRGTGDGRTLFDALNARGLIAFMTDGPRDLSTNPEHMEGFGEDGD
jgi:hypothetical protein